MKLHPDEERFDFLPVHGHPPRQRLLRPTAGLGANLLALLMSSAGAAPIDAGVLLETIKPPSNPPVKPPENLIQVPEAPRPAMTDVQGMHTHIAHVRFTGVSAFPDAVLQAVVADQLGKELGFQELEAMAARVTKYYRDRGFLVARAYLPEQKIADQSIEIMVLEGKMGQVTIHYRSPGPKISDEVMRNLVFGSAAAGSTIEVPKLERAMLFENELPNLAATASMVPGASVGTSDLVLEANQLGRFYHDQLTADNDGNKYNGAVRLGGNFNVASLAGLGDQLSAQLLTSVDGFNYERLAWTFPAGGSGLKLGASEAYTDYTLGGPYEQAGLHGNAATGSLFAVYPYVRTRFFNLYQTVTLEAKHLVNKATAGTISNNQVRDASLGINGDETDNWQGGGLSNFSATLTEGHVNLAEAPANASADAQTAKTAGYYGKVMLQAMRQQSLTKSLVLYGQITAQYSNKNLDSSESMVFGGPTAVRAYPVGEAPSDEGQLITLELRYNMAAPADLGSLQWLAFYDHGALRQHHTAWASFTQSGLPNDYALVGKGLGVNLYKENDYMLSGTVAWKMGSNPNPGKNGVDADGSTASSRIWVQLVKFL
ncbi:MAG: ShlB/FhaC/HecB family hemolysin secretion/activation protein [Burkholderiaceae bacterium]|nr:ShlB/FhaC/HecB family hemolysin secretion/activation protein [Roseateles sp.]MBV8468915.1 ShlB/FhaC/HecB family hemolysin secretion/activation protein [Burkholderiaceae bacterium]